MGNSPWVVVVVRSWCSKERHLVRMTMSTSFHAPPVVHYERSSHAAGVRLARWLEETLDEPSCALPADDDPAHLVETIGRDSGTEADPNVTDDIEESS